MPNEPDLATESESAVMDRAAALIASLRDVAGKEPADVAYLVEEIGRLGDEARPAETDLVALLSHEAPAVRQRAAWAIGQIGVAQTETLRALLPLLADKDSAIQSEAAESLGRAGAAAAWAQPELARLLGADGDADGRRWAAWALARVSADAPAAAAALTVLVGNSAEHPAVRREAAEGLGRLGVDSPAVLEALRAFLDHEDEQLARYAREALHRLGGDVPEPVEAPHEDEGGESDPTSR